MDRKPKLSLVTLYQDAKNDGLWPGAKNKHTQSHVWRRIVLSLNTKFSCDLTGKQWNTLKIYIV